MKILAIETSCDETAVAVLEAECASEKTAFTVLGNALYSQAAKHAEYGGVYPNLAKREHQENLVPLTVRALTEANLLQSAPKPTMINHSGFGGIRDEAFRNASIDFVNRYTKPDIDLIAVTSGPGLEPALWTGVSFAEALGAAWDIPVVGENHMEGHVVSALLEKEAADTVVMNRYSIREPEFPVLSLLISGGHTELVFAGDWFEYELVGRTRDDAVGEAFDKVARILGLPYPGGPEVAKAAASARARGGKNPVQLPRPMAGDDTGDFSFSGLKTAALYLVREKNTLSEEDIGNVAREFEDAARDVLVAKTARALEATGAKTLAVGGGVSANIHIREGLETLIADRFPDVALLYPGTDLTGDNAVMIGAAAYLRHQAGKSKTSPKGGLAAKGSLSLA
ncbi:MAG: tRNA (adenosine(37)-N6)-threonylcarbamoyltransferase complex transferase subunit TsaD [Candidatus Paceibacteria bacterium]